MAGLRPLAAPRSLIGSLVGSLFVASLTGCPQDPRDLEPPDEVARVGEKAVLRLDLLRELTWAGVARSEEKEVRAKLGRSILERLIDDEVLLAAARVGGFEATDDEVTRAISRAARGYPIGTFETLLHAEQMSEGTYKARVRRRLIIDRFLAQEVKDKTPVSDAELLAAYEKTLAQKVRPAQIRVRQVLVKTEEEAAHVLSEIKARRLSVEEAARRFSVAPEGEAGGLLPWFALGELPEVFNACFSLAPGQTSEVVASNYGFHIFQMVGRREAGPEPYASAKSELLRRLTREKEKQAIDALVARLRSQATISVDDAVLASVLESLPPAPSPDEAAPSETANEGQPPGASAPAAAPAHNHSHP